MSELTNVNTTVAVEETTNTNTNTNTPVELISSSSLIRDIRRNMSNRESERKERSSILEDKRKQGSAELVELLKELIPDKLRSYSKQGRSEARIFEFKFSDECKFGGCFAKDLLTKGTVISDLQEWFDSEHADEEGNRAFFIYFNRVGRPKDNPTDNKFAVFVNWDSSKWEGIQERLNRRHERMNNRGRDGRRGRGRGRGRGRRNNRQNDRQSAESSQSPQSPQQTVTVTPTELPTIHEE